MCKKNKTKDIRPISIRQKQRRDNSYDLEESKRQITESTWDSDASRKLTTTWDREDRS